MKQPDKIKYERKEKKIGGQHGERGIDNTYIRKGGSNQQCKTENTVEYDIMSYCGGNIQRKTDPWIADYGADEVARGGVVRGMMTADRRALQEGKQG